MNTIWTPKLPSPRTTKPRTSGFIRGILVFLALNAPLPFHGQKLQAQLVMRAVPVNEISVNDTARYLAGLPPSDHGRAAELAASSTWQAHAQALGSEWDRFAPRSWLRIRSWASSELSSVGNPHSPVFYPFSGPDFIYAYNYFPQASAYLLCGLEPVGEVPDLARIDSNSLGSLRASLHTLLTAGYFVTKEMRMELRGTLPLMMVMLARSGCTITHLERFNSGVEIHFIPDGGGNERRLVYLTTDLSNDGLRKGELSSRLSRFNPKNAFIKSASYLLHQNNFSSIRSLLLKQCSVIVQDDSGIPVRYFPPQQWTVRLYGAYTPPLNLFKEYFQPDLAELYAHTPTKPLDFGAGYKWNYREATLIVASSK